MVVRVFFLNYFRLNILKKYRVLGAPICSVHAHPRGEPKLLTSGTHKNELSGVVVIWNLRHLEAQISMGSCDESKIYHKIKFQSQNSEQLSHLFSYFPDKNVIFAAKCINCARFNSSGNGMLAAGSQYLGIYKLIGPVLSSGTLKLFFIFF